MTNDRFSILRHFLLIAVAVCAGFVFTASAAEKSAAPASFKVEVTGKGQPIILIPGLMCDASVWESVVAHYRDRYECHALTLAGFAGQPAIADMPFLEKVRTDLAAYIRERKMVKPVIVGHSLGGYLALSLAAHDPALIGKIVIVDSLPFLGATMTPDGSVETAKKVAAAMRDQMVSTTPENWRKFQRSSPWLPGMVGDQTKLPLIVKWAEDSDPKTAGNAMYELMTTDLRADLKRITAPTLVFGAWAGLGPQASKESVTKIFREQYAALPGFQLRMAETSRHFIMYDEEKWMLAEMDTFLKG
jgi:pimeloyl-ACP methyl ester carboxylesterase